MAKVEDGTRVYGVEQGWIRYRQVGDRVDERMSDNPACDWFETYEEAKAAFDGIDLEADWKTEKMCAGSMWKYDYRDAYKSIETWTEDEDGYTGDVEVLAFEKYGQEE